MIRLLAPIVALALALPALAGEITLRQGARLAAGSAVTLADVADLDGADAEALAQTIVATPGPGARRATVEPRDVRAALDATGVNWGTLTLRGARCEVLLLDAAPEAPIAPTTAPAIDPMHILAPDAPDTVHSAAGATLARLFGVEPADLKIAFDGADGSFLDTPGGPGRRIEVQPGASASGSRIPLNIWVYERDAIVASGQVRADVLVRRAAVVATTTLRRGQTITDAELSLETQWLEPGAGAPIGAIADAVGLVCRARVPAGTPLRAEHLERAVHVRRGELVAVHCISGGVVVKAQARALADGRDGELIELQVDKSRRSFTARVSGPGRAVLVVGETAAPQEPMP